MDTRKQLIALAVIFKGDWNEIYRHVIKRDFPNDYICESIYQKLQCGAVTIFDKDIYPENLRRIRNPPFVLFYYGDISLLNQTRHSLAVIGTREPTSKGIETTHEIINGLKKDVIVVSGLALGIDAEAHQAAIENGLRTIAVIGSGLNRFYPSENQELFDKIALNNLVVSEYPLGTPPTQLNFPNRNRIISGLSHAVLVTEARRRSGTTTTIAFALEQGIDVLCVPSDDLNNSACNLCIKEGAFLIENSDDVNVFF